MKDKAETAEAEPNSTVTAEADADADADATAAPAAKASATAEAETEPGDEPAEAETAAKPSTEAEPIERETETATASDSTPETEPAAEAAAPKAEAATEADNEPAEVEGGTSAAKTDDEPAEAKPEAEAGSAPASEADDEPAKAEAKPEAEPAAASDPEPEAAAKPTEAEAKAETEPAADVESETDAGPKVETAADAEAKGEPAAAAAAASEVEAEDGPKPAATPAADPEPKPAATPDPEPVTAATAAAPKTDAPGIPLGDLESRASGLVGAYTAAGEAVKAHGLDGQRAVVYLVLDRSGSMRGYFKDGTVQHLADQALALSARLDTSGTVPVVFFSTDIDGTAEIELDHHTGRIEELHGSLGHMGRTNYHTAVNAVIEHYKASGTTDPAFVIFQTDGAPTAKTAAEKALCEAAGLPLFWQFLAFGDPEAKGFDFLRKLDTSPALAVPEKRAVDNTGFFHAGLDPRTVADAELYREILKKFPGWLAAREQG
ncbi:toxic cation resistance protein [Streptomyces malaysiensis subsp. malaysiensis]|nr:toxic cation resistance protein [Streptomyces malaysiensis]